MEKAIEAMNALWKFAGDLVAKHGEDGDATLTDEEHSQWRNAVGLCHDTLNASRGGHDVIPAVVVEFNGGTFHCARATRPIRLIVLDEDTEGGDCDNIKVINGEEVYVTDFHLTSEVTDGNQGVDRDFVAEVIEQLDVPRVLSVGDPQ